jgi:hypothetical protein
MLFQYNNGLVFFTTEVVSAYTQQVSSIEARAQQGFKPTKPMILIEKL